MQRTLHTFILFCLAALALAPATAQAITYTVCAKYAITFDDAHPDVGDDYINGLGDRPARGARITVVRNSTGAIVADDWAEENGASVGCLTDVVATAGQAHTVTVWSEALIGGNTVEVMVSNQTGHPYEDHYYTEDWTWLPGALPTITFPTPVADQWNIATAAGFAASRNDGGMTGKTYRWYTEACPGGNPSCVTGSGEADPEFVGYMCQSGDTGDPEQGVPDCTVLKPAQKKYLIGHQMGHLVSIFATGDRAEVDLDVAEAACDGVGLSGHHLHSKEYQSSAAWEGIAHAWAAMAFNQTIIASDCGFDHYLEVDWDNDNAIELTSGRFDCDGILCPACTPNVDGDDYLGDECSTGTVDGMATELDWLRFWWDLLTDASLTDDAMFSVWGDAASDTWDPNGTSGSDHPPERLRAAAVPTYLTGHEWDTRATINGVAR